MKTIFLSTLAFVLCYLGFSFSAAKTGGNPPISENRSLSGFTVINAAFNGNIEVVQGESDKVVVMADPDKIKDITTRVEDGVLYISGKESYNKNCKNDMQIEAKVVVTIKNLTEIINASNGSFVAKNTLNGEKLEINNASNGKMELDLAYKKLICSTSANGRIILKGKTNEVEINNVMNGALDAENLIAQDLVLNNTANGRTNVYATNTLVINHAGNGAVLYSGNASPEIHNSGNGSIKRAVKN